MKKLQQIADDYGFDAFRFKEYLLENNISLITKFSGSYIDDADVKMAVDGYMPVHNEIKAKELQRQREQEIIKKEKEIEKFRREHEFQKEYNADYYEKRRASSGVLITSGFNFEGYSIKKYSGYISGDDSCSIDRGYDILGFTTQDLGYNVTKALVKIRRQAITELKMAAYDLGCNAVIGVDFDYITFEPETAHIGGGTTYLPYVVCVTANGSAVYIEKED